jgi:hypothetical protein
MPRSARPLHAAGHAVVALRAGRPLVGDSCGLDTRTLVYVGSAPATYRPSIAVALGGVAAELVSRGRLSTQGRRDLGAIVETLWPQVSAGTIWPGGLAGGAFGVTSQSAVGVAAERLGLEIGRGLAYAIGTWCAQCRERQ